MKTMYEYYDYQNNLYSQSNIMLCIWWMWHLRGFLKLDNCDQEISLSNYDMDSHMKLFPYMITMLLIYVQWNEKNWMQQSLKLINKKIIIWFFHMFLNFHIFINVISKVVGLIYNYIFHIWN
jgi:hypothetical protein